MSQITVTFEVSDDWPTPNHCLRVADALDALSTARYGDILRAYAHAEDARFTAHGPIRAARWAMNVHTNVHTDDRGAPLPPDN